MLADIVEPLGVGVDLPVGDEAVGVAQSDGPVGAVPLRFEDAVIVGEDAIAAEDLEGGFLAGGGGRLRCRCGAGGEEELEGEGWQEKGGFHACVARLGRFCGANAVGPAIPDCSEPTVGDWIGGHQMCLVANGGGYRFLFCATRSSIFEDDERS